MITVGHWQSEQELTLAESKGGVRVTRHPLENMVCHGNWPSTPPELLQKFYESKRFVGLTIQDDQLARKGLGFYCDLQSLNSEDAVTWSFFGNLAYLSVETRQRVCASLFERLDLPAPKADVLVWLWRRVPHPEKPESSGGPEIDFGLLSSECLVIGEAKWNSPLGLNQGVNKNRSQLDLRLAYCEKLVPLALPNIRYYAILGVGRNESVFPAEVQHPFAHVRNMTWSELASCFPESMASELGKYLEWRSQYAQFRS